MSFIGFWVSSCILSYFMEVISEGRIFKIAADNGYKLDIKNYSKIFKSLSTDQSEKINKLNKIMYFIPFFNIVSVFMKNIMLNENADVIISFYINNGILTEMSKEECEEYNKKPTIINSLIVPFKSELNAPEIINITLKDGSYAEYYIDNKEAEMKIVKVTGPLSYLSVEEQKKIIIKANNIECLEKAINISNERISNLEEKEKTFSKNNNLESITMQKEALIQIRDEILKEKERSLNELYQEYDENDKSIERKLK